MRRDCSCTNFALPDAHAARFLARMVWSQELATPHVSSLNRLSSFQPQVFVVVMTTQTWAPVAHEITFEQALIPAHATNSSAAGCSGRGDEGPGGRVPSQVTLDWARDKSRAEGCSNEEAAGNGAGLRAHVREGSVIVEGPDALCLVWDCKDAALVRYSKAGVEFVAEGQSLQRCNAASAGSTGGASKSVRQIFWRAHTDNDNGGPDTLARFGATRQMYPAECGFDKATPRVRGAMAFGLWWMDLFGDSSYGRMWEKKGLERLRAVDAQVEVMGQRDDGGEQGIGVLAVRCRCAFVADGTSTNIPCESLYTIHLDGSVVVEKTCMIAADMPPMPRIGMQLTLNQQFQELTYFGRGPVENYPDRCSGSKLGRYHCQVDDTFVPYIVPCDNGLRSHVRWAALTDPTGRGLVISAASPDDTLCLSAHRCTSHDLHHALHTPDVKFREEITVTVDHRHMPCGGNDSWTRAHLPQYLIKPGKYTYSVQLVPIASAGSIGRPLPPRTRGAPSSYTPPAQVRPCEENPVHALGVGAERRVACRLRDRRRACRSKGRAVALPGAGVYGAIEAFLASIHGGRPSSVGGANCAPGFSQGAPRGS